MFSRNRRNSHHTYQRVDRASLDPTNSNVLDSLDIEEDASKTTRRRSGSNGGWLGLLWGNRYRRLGPSRARWRRAITRVLFWTLAVLVFLVVATPIFNTSYLRKPAHYTGTNPQNEKVYIAANIVNEEMIRGAWGAAVIGLVNIIGAKNVFLSIYENDSTPGVRAALLELEGKIKAKSAIVSGHIDVEDLPTVQLTPQVMPVKRITYLAKVRNHALDPLSNHTDPYIQSTKFDKLLFLNDVVFDPKDAADLLFATNLNSEGKTDYHAACAMDFIKPIKFYDRFALRDNEGYESGLPFYPWFTNGGKAESLNDVLSQKDAVRVKSCWGGMVAFEGKWFQRQGGKMIKPLKFRSEPDTFWDASECCLVHADLADRVHKALGKTAEPKIYVNPYIRVAYDSPTFNRLRLGQRFEKLLRIPHVILRIFLRQPWGSVRRLETPGFEVKRREWVYEKPPPQVIRERVWDVSYTSSFGRWEDAKRVALPGGFCGSYFLEALKTDRKPGERMWEMIEPPGGY